MDCDEKPKNVECTHGAVPYVYHFCNRLQQLG